MEPKLSVDFVENDPKQEGIIHEVHQRPQMNAYRNYQNCTQVHSKNLVQMYLPKQADLDKVLKIIEKSIKGNIQLLHGR